MKRFALIALLLTACQDTPAPTPISIPTPTPTPVPTPVSALTNAQAAPYTSCPGTPCAAELTRQFHMQDPYWISGVVHAESVLPYEAVPGGQRSLWQPASKILKVELPAQGRTFVEGRDYKLTGNGIQFLVGGDVPQVDYNFLHHTDPTSPYYFLSESTVPGLRVRVSPDYDAYQVRVSYETPSRISPLKPFRTPVRFQRLLKDRQYARISFYGDSITVGANATSSYSAPHQPGFVELTVAALADQYPHQILYRNVSVAGWGADAAAAHLTEHVTGGKDDLVVMAYEANDASSGRTVAAYKADLAAMIGSVRGLNPDAEIVLVAGSLSNGEWSKGNVPLMRAYRDAMLELQADHAGVSVLDMTGVWDDVLTRKLYWDVTGNGINHPNDFGHWLYAVALAEGLNP